MALYGGAVGGYTTPSGQVVQMPAGLAGMFPSLLPQVQAPGPPPPGQQGAGGPDPAAAMLPPVGQPSGPPPGAPDPMTALPLPAGTSPTWSPQDSAELAQQTAAKQAQDDAELQALAQQHQKKVPAPAKRLAQAQESKPAQTNPDGTVSAQPLTNTDLAKMGVATPANMALAAEEEKKKAIEGKGTAEADQATAVAAAMKANEAADKKRLDDMQAEADRRQAQLDQHNADLMTQAKKIANTKIDRSLDHPWLQAIGVALATIGTAMQNRDAMLAAAFRGQAAPAPIENPGLKAMYAAIDRKVAAQMADLDKQKESFGMQQQAVSGERGILKDRLDWLAAHRVGYLENAKQEMARIEKETSVPLIKQNAALGIADVSREQAATVATAQERVQAQQNAEAARKQTMAIAGMQDATTRRGQDVQRLDTLDTIAAQKEERAAALAERLIEKGDTAAAARMKIIGEQGIVDPSTGDFMLTPAGQAKMQQADTYEAKARTATDPGQAAALNQHAQQLRDSARTNDAATALNKKGAEDAQKTAKIAQDMTNNVDAARRMLQGDPGAWNRDQWAQIKVALQGVKVNYAQQMGERMSPKALDAIDEVLSVDTDSITSRTVDKGKAIAALATVEQQINQSADVALKSAGVKSGWTPAKPTGERKYEGQTVDEAGDAAKPGLLTQYVVNPLTHPIDTATGKLTPDAIQQQARDEAAARTSTLAKGQPGQSNAYGLAPSDHGQVLADIKRASTSGNAEYDRIATSLAAPLTNEKRPSLAKGIAQLVRDEDPKLFEVMIAKVASSPGGGPEAAKRIEALTAAPPGARQAVTPAPPVPRGALQLPPYLVNAPPEVQRKYIEYVQRNVANVAPPEVAQ